MTDARDTATSGDTDPAVGTMVTNERKASRADTMQAVLFTEGRILIARCGEDDNQWLYTLPTEQPPEGMVWDCVGNAKGDMWIIAQQQMVAYDIQQKCGQ